MSDVDCPYCGAGVEICHDDGYGYEEGKPHEETCGACGKAFVFFTHLYCHYEAQKAECLNGSPHDFGEGRWTWRRRGRVYFRRSCKDCGEAEEKNEPEPEEPGGIHGEEI